VGGVALVAVEIVRRGEGGKGAEGGKGGEGCL
jgi:hypothetical protein